MSYSSKIKRFKFVLYYGSFSFKISSYPFKISPEICKTVDGFLFFSRKTITVNLSVDFLHYTSGLSSLLELYLRTNRSNPFWFLWSQPITFSRSIRHSLMSYFVFGSSTFGDVPRPSETYKESLYPSGCPKPFLLTVYTDCKIFLVTPKILLISGILPFLSFFLFLCLVNPM